MLEENTANLNADTEKLTVELENERP